MLMTDSESEEDEVELALLGKEPEKMVSESEPTEVMTKSVPEKS